MIRSKTIILGALAAVALSLSHQAKADDYPSRDITFINPYAPGGSTDPIARKFAAELEGILKANVIVENKPGGSATIGTGAVINAKPDGYTMGLGSNSSLVYHAITKKSLPWKTPDDYQSIVKLADIPAVLYVRTDSPWKTYADFLADVKKNPGKIRVSVSGLRTAPDLVVQQLNKLAGTRIVTVPFSGGGGEALLAMLGGRVEASVGYPASIKGQVDAGQIRVLGVFQKGKYPMFPDATPIGDTEFPATLPATYYVIAPKGIPAPILDKIMDASKKAVAAPDFVKFAEDNGYVVDPKSGDNMKAELEEYHKTFEDLIQFLDKAAK